MSWIHKEHSFSNFYHFKLRNVMLVCFTCPDWSLPAYALDKMYFLFTLTTSRNLEVRWLSSCRLALKFLMINRPLGQNDRQNRCHRGLRLPINDRCNDDYKSRFVWTEYFKQTTTLTLFETFGCHSSLFRPIQSLPFVVGTWIYVCNLSYETFRWQCGFRFIS